VVVGEMAEHQELPRRATADIARAYPNGRMHSCYHFTTRPLCAMCRGTHGTLDALTLRPGARSR
jgi:hypothetical protein